MQIAAVIIFILHLLPFLVDSNYLWGVDSWTYLHMSLPIIFSILFIISFDSRFKNAFSKLLEKSFSKSKSKTNLIVLATFLLLTIVLDQSTYFLGDGYLRIRNIESGIFFSGTEPFTTFLYSFTYNTLNGFIEVSGERVYAMFSQLFGVMSLLLVIKYADDNNFSGFQKGLAVIIFLSFGFIQLFFGYVESYALPAFLAIGFVFHSLQSLKKGKSLLPTSIILGFALASHTMMFLILPTYIYVVFLYNKKYGKKKNLLISLFVVVIVFVSLISVIGIYSGENPIDKYLYSTESNLILPLFSSDSFYGIFSIGHIVDILNEIISVFPLIILFSWLIKYQKNKDNNLIFLMFITIPFILFLLVFKPILGFARDWDLFSFFSIPIFMLILSKIKSYETNRINKLIPLIVMSIISSFSFIFVNAFEDSSLKRAENIADTEYWSDKSKTLLYDELTQYYRNNENYKKALILNDKAYEFEKNPRYLYRSAKISMKLNDFVAAEKYLLELSHTDYSNAEAFNFLADIYFNSKIYDKALKFYALTYEIEKDNFLALNNMGLINMQLGHFNKADSLFRKSIEINSKDSYIYYYIAICKFNLNEYVEAKEYALKAKEYGYKSSIVQQFINEIENKVGK